MNISGLVISFLYIGLILLIGNVVKRSDRNLSRSIIHIGVSNWWIIACFFFDNVFYAAVVPLLFVIINALSYKFHIIDAMERDEKGLGTVYYAISCLIITILSFTVLDSKIYGYVGMLVMGYGDALANIVGRRSKEFKYKIWNNEKSLSGSIAMFVVCALVLKVIFAGFGLFDFGKILLLAFGATVIENLTPYHLDNLTVPLLSFILSIMIL